VTTEITIIGKGARTKVLEALSKSFPTSTAEVGGRVLKSIHHSPNKENTTMSHDSMMAQLDKNMSLLEAEIDEIVKQSRRNKTVDDDWSAAADDDTANNDDNGDTDPDDDDEDEEDDDLGKSAPPMTHKFESKIAFIQHRDGCTRAAAQTKARLENPTLFQNYQQSGLVGNAADSGQQLTTYDKMVRAEIRKGCSPNVAAQRVSYAHPDLARQTLAKAAASPVEFMAKVDEAMQANGCSRTAAMQQVRKQFPSLFAKFQNV
jgi:regulator of RNase E activity RraB